MKRVWWVQTCYFCYQWGVRLSKSKTKQEILEEARLKIQIWEIEAKLLLGAGEMNRFGRIKRENKIRGVKYRLLFMWEKEEDTWAEKKKNAWR